MSDVINIENQFADALADAGFPATEIIADGKIHRISGPEDKASKKNGWYVLHIGRLGAGAFGDWKTGHQATWCSKAESMFTPEDREQWRKQLQDIRNATEQETKKRQEEAAAKAKRIWDAARDATDDNPYCQAKGVKPYGLKEFKDARTLIVPIRTFQGQLTSLQFIYSDGTKKFLSGGMKANCYYSFGPKPKGRILIAEGFSTGASLHEATGLPVAVAFDCGNLSGVARALSMKLARNVEMIICADDDAGTAANPGMTAAHEAARVNHTLLAVPDFGDSRPDGATDFNDLAKHAGLDAVKACIDAASAPGGVTAPAVPRKRSAAQVILSRASDIEPEAIYWLWQNWVPAGKLSILAGQPGCGKTTIALSIASTISRGGDWPDGTKCTEPRNVLIWTGEDGLADTLVPRLRAAGADCSRIWFVESVEGEDGKLLPFDPSHDVLILSEKIKEIGGASLLIVDPIISVVNGDGHKSIDVRKSLQPLLDLGTAHNCAIFGITHFSKGSKASAPIDRILGSQAFGAAARMILIAGKDESSDRRILAKSKCNIAIESGAFEYAIEVIDGDGIPSSRVAWGDPVEGSARDILREIEADDLEGDEDSQTRSSKFERVRCMLYEWLRPFMSTKEMKAAAAAEGISWRTVERAKDAEIEGGAKIRAVKQGKDWGWIWDNSGANHGDVPAKSTPPLTLISSPPRIQVRQDDGGVESLTQQGFPVKSATPPSIQEPPRAHARPRAHAHVPSGGVDFLADLTANPSPSMESTPPSTPPSENHGGLESDNGGVDANAEETDI